MRSLALALFSCLLLIRPALAGSAPDAGEEEAWHAAQEQAASSSFNAIMETNARPARRGGGKSGMALSDAGVSKAMETTIPLAPTDGTAEVPLSQWDATRSAVDQLRRESQVPPPPLVVLGATRYSGEAVSGPQGGGALRLRLDLHVTLAGEGLWKTVPLVGEEAVVVAARTSDGRALPLSSRDGYHVWVTEAVGEQDVVLELLVPGSGRRGSLEYELRVAQTPITRFACEFAAEGLEPRLRGAVRAEVTSTTGRTRLEALLAPTSRIHLVGFRDMGSDDSRAARVYGETLGLLSVDEDALELFAVVRYHILYAGRRNFDLRLPVGWSVVSADGQGAFRYTLEEQDDGVTILRGETAFPIRSAYEVSLRLRRDAPESGERFTVALPRSLDVEREYGWLGAEVPGTLLLEELSRDQATAVDVRQLPFEVVQASVSPVLRAWRTHSPDSSVQLQATRLPDLEPQSAAIDRVEADTVLSEEGRVLTDVRITLRNRLRHSLRIQLPEGAEVRSALLSGEPVKPGRGDDGVLRFPLERSRETASGLQPFTLQLVIERDVGSMGLFGRRELALPALELPVSSLAWRVWAPSRHEYSGLQGELDTQSWAGAGQWHQPPAGMALGAGPLLGEAAAAGSAGSSESGAMPVRIELPHEGQQLSMTRYWIPADAPVTAWAWHWRGWLRSTAEALLGLAVLIALSTLALRRGWLPSPLAIGRRLVSWWRTDPAEGAGATWTQRHALGRLGLLGGTMGTGLLLFIATMRWLTLVGSPL